MLKGKRAFVTGAGSGIGEAIARSFVRGGAAVVIADIAAEKAEAVAVDLQSSGAIALGMYLDVSDSDAVTNAVHNAAQILGGLDITVANAGIGFGKPFFETTAEDFARVHAINLAGVFYTLQSSAREMIARDTGGRLIAMASVTGQRGCAKRAAYGSAKAGVIGLVQVAAVELAEHGITVNAVAPGPISTPLVESLHTQEIRKSWLASIPQKRYGTVDEVAAVVQFLAGNGASYITGQVIAVDGGWSVAGLLDA